MAEAIGERPAAEGPAPVGRVPAVGFEFSRTPTVLLVLGVALQFFVPLLPFDGAGYAMGLGSLLVLVGAWWAVDARVGEALDLTPKLEDKRRWTAATPQQLERIEKKLTRIDGYGGGCLWSCLGRLLGCGLQLSLLVGLFFVIDVATRWVGLTGREADGDADLPLMLCFDFFCALVAWWRLAAPTLWRPDRVESKLGVLRGVVAMLAEPELKAGGWGHEFQLELAGVTGRPGEVPTDLKMVLKAPKAPPAFIGVQVQVTFNMGSPYVYFVVLTKPPLAPARPSGDERVVLEDKRTPEANILVVRQYADRQGGYNTDADQQRRLLGLALVSAQRTLAAASIAPAAPAAASAGPAVRPGAQSKMRSTAKPAAKG